MIGVNSDGILDAIEKVSGSQPQNPYSHLKYMGIYYIYIYIHFNRKC